MTFSSMRMMALVAAGVLSGCGGGGGTTQPSTGLKIFATANTHNGGFLADTALSGTTAIEKADDFCATDPNKPDSGTYKAILVDGVHRDALVPTDWVLKPNTAYYQATGGLRICVTTGAAIFPETLENEIHATFGESGGNNSNTSTVWTGFADPVSFTTGTLTCNGWSDYTNNSYAPYGISYGTDGSAWYTDGGQVCSLPSRLYCAEQ